MKKKFSLLMILSIIFLPTLSFAIGLGAVRTYSNLNEKLNAKIPVLSTRKENLISVSLAPNYIFLERGVIRSDSLNDLTFSLSKINGRTYVLINSNKKVTTPYLNFILELKSTNAKVYREYAIFLDPAVDKFNKKMLRNSKNKPNKVKKNSQNIAKNLP